MKEKFENKVVIKLGDNINTDLIHPAEFFSLQNSIISRGLFKGFNQEIQLDKLKEKIIVAGKNLGCGSSREVYAKALKIQGINTIIAESFANIFYRNLVNNGILPIILETTQDFKTDDKICILEKDQFIINNRTKIKYSYLIDDYILNIIKKGGLINIIIEDINEL